MAVHPSHEQEQAGVRGFFAGKTSGTFVEVGANHPTEGSQTWHLEQAGWGGVLVEPQQDLAAFLAESRKSRVLAVACSSPENAGQSLAPHVDGPRSALDHDRMTAGAEATSVIQVPARTLDSVLQEAEVRAPIDLLSIDVEGHEAEVLQGFDFSRWRPRLILIEDHVHSLRTHHMLTRHGYRLIRRLGLNGWYVPAGHHLPIALAERWEILRKYYLALPFRKLRHASRRVRRLYADWQAGR